MEVFAVETLDRRYGPLAYEATISKIGRKWITASTASGRVIRFDAVTRHLDGGAYSSPGMVYASKAEYRETTARQKAWKDFRQILPYDAPDHLSEGDIAEIRDMIFPDEEKADQ